MNANAVDSANTWNDPDDAPELDEAFFARADLNQGHVTIRRGRPISVQTKIPVKIRFDADIVTTFRASGKGWQTRMNNALREYLRNHSA